MGRSASADGLQELLRTGLPVDEGASDVRSNVLVVSLISQMGNPTSSSLNSIRHAVGVDASIAGCLFMHQVDGGAVGVLSDDLGGFFEKMPLVLACA